MKVKCIKDHETIKKGFLSRTEYQEKIEGLTRGKIYQATVVSDVTGGQIATDTEFLFMLYNDNREWMMYDMDYFESVNE